VFVAGDRGGSQRNQIQIPREFDAIQDKLRACEHRDAISIATPILAATHEKLIVAYRHRPGIIHFAGHGDDRSLSFISDQDVLVTDATLLGEQLSAILANFPERIRLCVLNTCNSADIAGQLAGKNAAEAAIGWPCKVADSDAVKFSGIFYGCIGDGLSLAKAVALASQSFASKDKALIFTANAVDPSTIVYIEST
jgi:hypothetical protein